jgi:hypothetical protein
MKTVLSLGCSRFDLRWLYSSRYRCQGHSLEPPTDHSNFVHLSDDVFKDSLIDRVMDAIESHHQKNETSYEFGLAAPKLEASRNLDLRDLGLYPPKPDREPPPATLQHGYRRHGPPRA